MRPAEFRPAECRAGEGCSGHPPAGAEDRKLLFDAVTARLRSAVAAHAGLVSNLPLAESAACLARTVLECTEDLQRLQEMLDPPRGSRAPDRDGECRTHAPGREAAGFGATGTTDGAAGPDRR